MLEFIGHLISGLLSGGTNFDVDSTHKQRVKHAMRISRKRSPLTPEQHEFALAWLKHALANLPELRMEDKEVALRMALLKVSHAKVTIRMT